jgi:peptidyl-prolyl cis-trans isomerase B (cyclophilin B)
MSKQSRQRELARLRARREAERQRARRRRALLTYGGLAAVVAVTVLLGGLWLNRDQPSSTAAAPSTAPSTVPPNDARADAPTAPTTVACGGTVPKRVKHPTFKAAPTTKVDAGKTYLATFQTSCGRFAVRLDPSKAPITTANFVFLAGKKFYDSTWFHRIVPGGQAGIAVIQGGDPQGDGRGGPGYTIPDEVPKSKQPYKKYTLAMANGGTANSGGSQFFINTADNRELPRSYTVFGTVVSGQSVVDRIAAIPVTLRPGAGSQQGRDFPTQAAWIQRLTVTVT